MIEKTDIVWKRLYRREKKIKYFLLIVMMLVVTGSVESENLANESEDKKEKSFLLEHEKDFLRSPPLISKDREIWTLIWSDDFKNESSLKNWNLQDWASNKNGEWQYYSPENIKVNNDLLIIESKREEFKGREYTSGALTTENILEITYGKIEIRAKLPTGQGIFPAFWLVNSNENNWLPEIDIMENLGQHSNELYFVVHWEDTNGKKMRDYSHYINANVDFSKEFHIYGLVWENDKITWLVDGLPVYETEKYSPSTPLFLYLNTAIGGFWPGDPDPLEVYPKEMQIDYIRVYKKMKGD